MSVADEYLANNAAYASDFKGPLRGSVFDVATGKLNEVTP